MNTQPATIDADAAEIPEFGIYAACLASYNAGRLHGRWIDAEQDADDIRTEIDAMLAGSPIAGAEEWAIHAYTGLPDMGEHPDLADVADAAALGAELGADVIVAWHENNCGEWYQLNGCYLGKWDGLAAYAESAIEDFGYLDEISEKLRYYFDYERYGRDLELGGDVWTAPADDGGIHVFASR